MTLAALIAVLPGAAHAAPVIVNFSGTYSVYQPMPLAGTNFTGSFAYDDSTAPSSIGSYYGDGTIQDRFYNNFLTSAFTITDVRGTFSSAPADTHLQISYGPYASNSKTTTFNLTGNVSVGAFLQFYLVATDYISNNVTFAKSGLPGVGDYPPLSLDFGGSAYAKDNGDLLTSLTASAPTPAVPEPATWGMMIAGLGATGATMRRRRSRAMAYA